MGITLEKGYEILKKRGIESEKELQEELKDKAIEIGMFIMPFKNSDLAKNAVENLWILG